MEFEIIKRWFRVQDRKYLFALSALLVAGLLLRVYLSFKIPLWNDEAITANVARTLSENGIPSLPSGKEYWRGFPYVVLVSISERIFGHGDVATRIPSILIGTGTIALTYITGKEFFNRKTGLVAASIVAFLPWQLAFGTQVRMYVMLQFLYLASILLIYRLGERINVSEIFLLALTISLAMATHRTAYILPILTVAYLIGFKFKSFDLKKVFYLLIPITAAFIVQFLYKDYLGFIYVLGYQPENLSYYSNWLVRNQAFLIFSSIFGGFLGLRKNGKTVYILSLGVIPAFLIYGLFVEYRAQVRYIHFMIPMLSILTGIFFSEIVRVARSETSIPGDWIFAVAIIFVLAFTALGQNYGYDESVYRPYFDQESVYDYISDNKKDDEILITQWTSSATYYYRPPDYSLQGEDYKDIKQRYGYEGRSIYSGAEFVSNTSRLDEIVTNSNGWLVMRRGGYQTKPKQMQDVIDKEMEEVGEFKYMRVWKWNQSEEVPESE